MLWPFVWRPAREGRSEMQVLSVNLPPTFWRGCQFPSTACADVPFSVIESWVVEKVRTQTNRSTKLQEVDQKRIHCGVWCHSMKNCRSAEYEADVVVRRGPTWSTVGCVTIIDTGAYCLVDTLVLDRQKTRIHERSLARAAQRHRGTIERGHEDWC
jgi:hypothetical protein